jgi:hypothetical protein
LDQFILFLAILGTLRGRRQLSPRELALDVDVAISALMSCQNVSRSIAESSILVRVNSGVSFTFSLSTIFIEPETDSSSRWLLAREVNVTFKISNIHLGTSADFLDRVIRLLELLWGGRMIPKT